MPGLWVRASPGARCFAAILCCNGEELKGKRNPPRPGIEPGPSTWQAEILTTRLSRNWYYVVRTNLKWILSFCYQNSKNSFEPDLNQRPMDIWHRTTTVHRSTNWAIEGWIYCHRCYVGISLIGWGCPWKRMPLRTTCLGWCTLKKYVSCCNWGT